MRCAPYAAHTPRIMGYTCDGSAVAHIDASLRIIYSCSSAIIVTLRVLCAVIATSFPQKMLGGSACMQWRANEYSLLRITRIIGHPGSTIMIVYANAALPMGE